MRPSTKKATVLAALILAAPLLRAQTEEYGFMPPGGRALILGLFGSDPVLVAETAGRSANRGDWEIWALEDGRLPDARSAATFAAYAAINFPLPEDRFAALSGGDLEALPHDGKDLAIAHCQFCHSFFTGYLMLKREESAWLGTFNAPFHTKIEMSDTERATFAAYSALNMPLKFEDVPPELRF